MIYENGYPHILYVLILHVTGPILPHYQAICFMFYICVCSNSLNWEKVKGKVHIDILGMCRLNEGSMHRLVG